MPALDVSRALRPLCAAPAPSRPAAQCNCVPPLHVPATTVLPCCGQHFCVIRMHNLPVCGTLAFVARHRASAHSLWRPSRHGACGGHAAPASPPSCRHRTHRHATALTRHDCPSHRMACDDGSGNGLCAPTLCPASRPGRLGGVTTCDINNGRAHGLGAMRSPHRWRRPARAPPSGRVCVCACVSE